MGLLVEDKLFSIIMPIYNRERCIQKAIDSIVNQSYDNWELLLIDDGSTDTSGEVCRSYVKVNNRIIYVHQDNGGVSSARNPCVLG